MPYPHVCGTTHFDPKLCCHLSMWTCERSNGPLSIQRCNSTHTCTGCSGDVLVHRRWGCRTCVAPAETTGCVCVCGGNPGLGFHLTTCQTSDVVWSAGTSTWLTTWVVWPSSKNIVGEGGQTSKDSAAARVHVSWLPCFPIAQLLFAHFGILFFYS